MILLLILAPVRVYRDALAAHLDARSAVSVVGTVATPQEAICQADELGADVVLADASSPEALASAQSVARARRDLHLIALAMPEREPEIVACAEAGIRAFVPAGADTDDVVAALRAVVRGEAACSSRIAAILLRRVAAAARAGPPPLADAPRDLRLTSREREIVSLIDRGLSNKEIAADLCIEVSTVKNHVHNILEKLGVRRRAEAAARVRVYAEI